MDKPINIIGDVTSPGNYKTPRSKPAAPYYSDVRNDISKASSKYILQNNKIIFERYDPQGNVISRVPLTANSINERV